MRRVMWIWLLSATVAALSGCSWGTSRPQDAGRDDGAGIDAGGDPGGDPGPAPSHQGFDVVDQHGAVRISYLDDALGGYDFDGRWVVYSSFEFYLYLIDLENQAEVRLYPEHPIPGNFTGVRTWPSLANGVVASIGHDGVVPPRILYLYYTTNKTWRKVELPGALPSYFDFDGTRIAFNDERHWDEDGGQNVEVYLYELATATEQRITHEPRQQFVPEIDGDRIVWEDYRKGYYNEEIVLHDLRTGQSRDLTNDETRQFGLSIYGDLIAWTDLRNGHVNPNGTYTNADVYLYRISTGELRQLTDEEHDQEYPSVHGRWVAWEDLRHGSRNQSGQASGVRVYVHDLQTNQERMITFGEEQVEGTPRIWGNTLVYRSCCTDSGGALWMVDLGRYFDLGGG